MDGFIIEDDYDTEFRFQGRPLAPMQTMDPERVIYMNTFSKTLSPSIRISYMVLPQALMARFREKLGFLRLHRAQLRAVYPGLFSGPGVF